MAGRHGSHSSAAPPQTPLSSLRRKLVGGRHNDVAGSGPSLRRKEARGRRGGSAEALAARRSAQPAAHHHGGQVSGIGHTLSRHAGGLLAGPACPPSHLKMPVRERLGVVARHATHMASRRDGGRACWGHGTRPLAACVGIGASLQHLVGEPRTCCGHLPSGTGSRFVREMRDEQRSGELAAAHPHTRFVMTIS